MGQQSQILSFRAEKSFVSHTDALATSFGMDRSEYVRRAVEELNQRMIEARLDAICTRLGAQTAAADAAFEVAVADGL